MVDETHDLEPESDETDDDGKNRRSLYSVIVATIVIVIIILVLLLLRGCGTTNGSGRTSSGSKTITSVDGLKPEPGAISVWVTEGTNIDSLLRLGDIRSSDVVNMGGGRFVVVVPKGSENVAMRKLAKVAGVIDTGRVYGNGATK